MLRRNAAVLVVLFACAALSACHATTALPPRASMPQGARSGYAVAVGATDPQFRQIGPTHMTSGGLPTSGKVNAFAVDPRDAQRIYVASGRGTGLETYSSAGIYRTSDGGASWIPIDRGLTDRNGLTASTVNALMLDPQAPQTLLAATEYDGIFRSTDRGNTWRNVFRTTGATQFARRGAVVYAATAAGVLASSNFGATWRVALATSSAATAIAGSGAYLYAGFGNGTIYVDAGSRWSVAGTLPFTAQTGTDGSTPAIHQIAVDPRTPTTLYATSNDGTWDQALFASTDAGRTWHPVLQSAYATLGLGTQAIAFSQVHPHRLFLGEDGGFYYIDAQGEANPQPSVAAATSVIDIRDLWTVANGSDDACWIASDQGLDFVPQCSAPGNAPHDNVVTSSAATGLARHFAISPNAKTILVSLQDFDSHVTLDGGAHWSEQYLYEDGFVALRPGNPQVCYAYDEAVGLSISTNGCVSFPNPTGEDATLIPSRLMTAPIAFDPRNPLAMYLLTGPIEAPGPTGLTGVFHSTDGGQTFKQLAWPFTEPGSITVDAKNGRHIVVSDLNANRSSLSVTFDGGTTWQRARGVPATAFWYSVTISPTNPRHVLATSVDAANNVFVLRSTDGGARYTRLGSIVNAPLIRGRLESDRHAGRRGERREPERRQPFGPPPAFVYSPAREIRYDPAARTGTPPVVVTTLRGAYLSRDDGTTWRRIDRTTIAHSFWSIGWLNGYLYLASDGQGILRSTTRLGP